MLNVITKNMRANEKPEFQGENFTLKIHTDFFFQEKNTSQIMMFVKLSYVL